MHLVKPAPGGQDLRGRRLGAGIRQPPVEGREDAVLKGALEQIIPIRHPGQGNPQPGESILRLGETVEQDLILRPGLRISFCGGRSLTIESGLTQGKTGNSSAEAIQDLT